VEKGAVMDVGVRSLSPLVLTVRDGYHDMVRFLPDKGAGMPSLESAEGKKLLDFVRPKEDLEMERILLLHQSDSLSSGSKS
jgi:hypothetical protein